MTINDLYPLINEGAVSLKRQPLSIRAITFTALFSAIFVVLSTVSIPIGISPIPITMQTFAILLAGIMLGPFYGFCSILLVMVLAAFGLPLFNGNGGLPLLLGPTGGFIWMFPFAAMAAGFAAKWIRGRGVVSFLLLFVALVVSSALVYVTGVLWYAHLSGLSIAKAVAGAVIPYIPGDLVKAFGATAVLVAMRRLNLMPSLAPAQEQVVKL